jgi:hypothetical protein
MRFRLLAALLAGACLGTIGLIAEAQETSLGDVARAARKNKPAANTATKVYDNDTLPSSPKVSVAESDKASAATDKSTADAKTEAKDVSAAENAPRASVQEEVRASLAVQKRKVADLEMELNQLERDNRVAKGVEDSDKTRRKPICWVGFGALCADPASQMDPKYVAYVKQRDAKKAELDSAVKKLDEMQKDARVIGTTPN